MSDTEISISTGETVEITYSISSTGELDEIIDIDTENKEFEDYDFKNIKKFTWTPTDDDVGTHEFTVNGEEISIEVNEIPDSVVEQFDSGNLSNYSGDVGGFDVNQNSPVFIGDNSLKTPGGSSDIVSTSGKDTFPQQGDRFSQRVHYDGGSGRTNMVFGVQDIDNFYLVQVQTGENIDIFVQDGGSFTSIADTTTPSLSNNEWLEFEIEWLTDGTINFELFGPSDETSEKGSSLANLSANDTTFTDGGIGFRHNNDGTFAFDYYVIWERGI